ncbi:MAG: hypothetical protein DRQ41_15230 [Gammaproteobacteria bacterium]|nr:MAG: hypothetical protein DRQ41_15230 [Gammaproteobacteria bacterium]
MVTTKFEPGDQVYTEDGYLYVVKKSFLRDVNFYVIEDENHCRMIEREEELMTPSEYSDFLDQETDDLIEELEKRLNYLEGL